jgi:hypothetical protein
VAQPPRRRSRRNLRGRDRRRRAQVVLAAWSATGSSWTTAATSACRSTAASGRSGQTSAGLADKARALYGERYAEFLDNVQTYAYFPIAVMNDVSDFREGSITVRFKGVAGRIDQGAGILFNVQPNGDYLALRANPLEDNLVLWKYEKGRRSSVNGFATRRHPRASGTS